MARNAVELTRTANAAQSLGSISADATRPRRLKLYYLSLGSEATSAEPTYAANSELKSFPFNQRATVQWYAPTEGELVTPATASNGLGFDTPTIGAAVSLRAMLHVNEM